ncbi:hypothetical protein BJV77DRAFT_1072649 [Russula vinacea]|nr:hypothetical protein BJV77DRAFT_1072649 [Russula vinacea]
MAEHRPELDGKSQNILETTVSYKARAWLTPTFTHVVTYVLVTSGAEGRAMSQWGHFNDWLVNPSWIRGLMESYKKGVHICMDVTTIDAMVKRHWVSNLDKIMPSTEGEHIENVLMMMFMEAGMQEMVPNNFWMLGGNHQHLALDFWVKEQKKQLEIQEGPVIQEADQAICDLDEKSRNLENGFFNFMTGVKKIEESKKDEAYAIFWLLSQNETKGSHRATEEELLQEHLDELKLALQKDLDNRGTMAEGNYLKMFPIFHMFVFEFLLESLEILERIANPKEPPLQMEDIEKKHDEVLQAGNNLALLKLLGKIDECFVKHYMDAGKLVDSLFTPDFPDNFNQFVKYCANVDEVLAASANTLRFSREYFTFYSIWQLRGYSFPVLLRTALVVDALNKISMKLQNGFVECISWMATLVSWLSKFNAKKYIQRDQFQTMITQVDNDVLVDKNAKRIGRNIFKIFFMHLTTMITEIELYFSDNPTIHDIQVNLKPFQKIVKRNQQKAHEKAKPQKKTEDAKGKKAAARGEDTDYCEAVNDFTTTTALFKMLDIDEEIFMQGYRKLYAILSSFPFELEHRLNSDLEVRLLAMSGLTWNTKTKGQYRDQAHIAIAMRHAIYKYLRDSVASYQWSFPDNIPSDFGVDVPCDLDTKKHPIHSVIDQLLDHPLLCSSEPGVPDRSVEDMAYYLIEGLAQMMSFNHQRIEHEKRDKLTPFSRSMFQPYTFPSRNHIKTNAYHDDFFSYGHSVPDIIPRSPYQGQAHPENVSDEVTDYSDSESEYFMIYQLDEAHPSIHHQSVQSESESSAHLYPLILLLCAMLSDDLMHVFIKAAPSPLYKLRHPPPHLSSISGSSRHPIIPQLSSPVRSALFGYDDNEEADDGQDDRSVSVIHSIIDVDLIESEIEEPAGPSTAQKRLSSSFSPGKSPPAKKLSDTKMPASSQWWNVPKE